MGMLSLRLASGYDIRQMVQTSIGYFWNESYGRIYPVLKELVAEGLIQPGKEKGKMRSARDRQVYAITSQGEEALHRWLQASARAEPNRSELLLKLFFGYHSSPHGFIKMISAKRELEQRNLQVYEGVQQDLERQHQNHPGLAYWLMTLSYGRRRSQAIIDWCDESLRRLSRLQKDRKQKKRRKEKV